MVGRHAVSASPLPHFTEASAAYDKVPWCALYAIHAYCSHVCLHIHAHKEH